MQMQYVLKPQFLPDSEMQIKEKNISNEEKKQIIDEMISLVEKNIAIEKEIEAEKNACNFQ